MDISQTPSADHDIKWQKENAIFEMLNALDKKNVFMKCCKNLTCNSLKTISSTTVAEGDIYGPLGNDFYFIPSRSNIIFPILTFVYI